MTHTKLSHKVFLTSLCCIAAAPALKVGDVQVVELFLLAHILFLILKVAYGGWRFKIPVSFVSLGIPYAIFIGMVILLAIASMRFRFYPPPDISFLKRPLLLSIARVTEIALGIFYMLYVASILRTHQDARLYALRTYFRVGSVSALYSLLCYPIFLVTHLEWGVYLPDLRARGWFNEGGPYGLYLASVMLVGLLLYNIGGLKNVSGVAGGLVILSALVASQSKATFFAGGILLLCNLLLTGSVRQKVALISIASLFGAGIWTLTPFPDLIGSYIHSYEMAEEYGAVIDANVYGGLEGRVGGAILVPRMISAHPVTGIGLGNYSLLRNSPEYLQGLPTTNIWDLPGIGLIAYIAELGIPLFIYLMVLLCLPAWRLKDGVPPLAFLLAAYQPIAHIFGVQLNFYYPWICSGFALSIPAIQTSVPNTLPQISVR